MLDLLWEFLSQTRLEMDSRAGGSETSRRHVKVRFEMISWAWWWNVLFRRDAESEDEWAAKRPVAGSRPICDTCGT